MDVAFPLIPSLHPWKDPHKPLYAIFDVISKTIKKTERGKHRMSFLNLHFWPRLNMNQRATDDVVSFTTFLVPKRRLQILEFKWIRANNQTTLFYQKIKIIENFNSSYTLKDRRWQWHKWIINFNYQYYF